MSWGLAQQSNLYILRVLSPNAETLNKELKNIDHHHPESKKRKSSEGNLDMEMLEKTSKKPYLT